MVMPSDFTSLSLPTALVEAVDAFVERSGGMYRSRADVAKTAIRAFLEARQPSTSAPTVPA